MTCPIPNCTATVAPGKLLCCAHWKRVPFKQQMAVQRAWRNFQQASKPNMKLACLRVYRAARDAAVASVSQREIA